VAIDAVGAKKKPGIETRAKKRILQFFNQNLHA